MADSYKDYYATLGVKKEASADEIKQAYRRLAKVHHPDLTPEPGKAAAAEKFKTLNEAYEVLSNAEKRTKYDRFGADWERASERPEPERPRSSRERPGASGGGEGAGFSGFSDFFDNLYGGEGEGSFSSGRGARSGGRGQDVEAEMPLTLEEAVRGGEKTITLSVPAVCPVCGGSGRKGRSFCPSCGGVGETSRPKTITARLPAAARDGMRLRLKGQGSAAPGRGEPGDLYLRITLLPHADFQVSGADLETNATVMPWIAGLGGEAAVATLDGPLRIKIAPGTHAGRVLRVAGKGLGREGGGRGDLHVRVRIDIPDRANARLEKLYNEMREAAS